MMRRFAFIGDVHSQSKPLEAALDYCFHQGLTPILLGDLFDSLCSVSDSAGVYNAVRDAQKSLGAIVLQSNHQFILQRLAERKEVPLKKDLARTFADFAEAGVCIQDVYQWLEKFPYAIAFRDSRGKEYRVCHAEFPKSVEVPENYLGVWEFYDPTPEEIRLLLWGKPYSVPERDRFWWLARNETPREWVAVAGHYHKTIFKKQSLVLDAGCGGVTRSWFDKRSPELLLFDVEREECVAFPA